MRKLLTKFLMVLFILPVTGFSQTLEWAYKIGGSYQDQALDIVKDSLGNIYLTGGICNSVDFNPHGLPYIVNATGTDKSDVFVAKYNKDFELLWAFAIGSDSWEVGAVLMVDDSLNVFVIGEGYGAIDFDPTSGTHIFDCSSTNSFIAKYSKDGVFVAVNMIPEIPMYPPNVNIYSDVEKNIFVYSNDTLSKFDPALQLIWKNRIAGNPELFKAKEFFSVRNFTTPFYSSYSGPDDSLILNKYHHSNGNLICSKLYAFSSGFINGGYIKKTKSDKLLISGSFWGDMSFFGNNDTITVHNADMGTSPYGTYPLQREFIAMYDTMDNVIWAKAYDDSSPEPYIMETADSGNIYTLGFLNFDANFDPDGSQILTNGGYGNYIAKYDSNFVYQAAAEFLGGSYNDFIGEFKLYDDTAVMCGHFFNTIDLDLTASNFSLSAAPPEDIFVAKYSEFDIETNPVLVPDLQVNEAGASVFPNPSEGKFYVHLSAVKATAEIIVTDLNGAVIHNETPDKADVCIDLSEYPASVYFLRIVSGNAITTKKIVKIN